MRRPGRPVCSISFRLAGVRIYYLVDAATIVASAPRPDRAVTSRITPGAGGAARGAPGLGDGDDSCFDLIVILLSGLVELEAVERSMASGDHRGQSARLGQRGEQLGADPHATVDPPLRGRERCGFPRILGPHADLAHVAQARGRRQRRRSPTLTPQLAAQPSATSTIAQSGPRCRRRTGRASASRLRRTLVWIGTASWAPRRRRRTRGFDRVLGPAAASGPRSARARCWSACRQRTGPSRR